MGFVEKRVFVRSEDEKEITKLTEYLSNNADALGFQVNDNYFHEGSFELSFQDKSNSFILEIKTANEKFVKELTKKIKKTSITDFKIIGEVKNEGDNNE